MNGAICTHGGDASVDLEPCGRWTALRARGLDGREAELVLSRGALERLAAMALVRAQSTTDAPPPGDWAEPDPEAAEDTPPPPIDAVQRAALRRRSLTLARIRERLECEGRVGDAAACGHASRVFAQMADAPPPREEFAAWGVIALAVMAWAVGFALGLVVGR